MVRINFLRAISSIFLTILILDLPIQAQESNDRVIASKSDYTLTHVRILPEKKGPIKGFSVLGSIVGPDKGFVVLAECGYEAPGKDGWIDVRIKNAPPYRWLRLEGWRKGISPVVAEVEFISPLGKMSGTPYGSEVEGIERSWERAFDGDPKTNCVALGNLGYVAIDLGSASQATLQIGPASDVYTEPIEIELQRTPPDAIIHYTLDGSVPTRESGKVYEKPIRFESSGAITAIAFKQGIAATLAVHRTYASGASHLRSHRFNRQKFGTHQPTNWQ